ncbi:DUF1543 domain-containing protein [Kaistella flava (ex Peng et al. 2021)]|uniref:DUF1543 domain-containing protein n=1 Tax=Kaistella flava (ex Peng et al. 2021) TaxID=2038776 RepID=A0A7M2YDS4_9FLAO|nr:DUF1543 domain-containing protein [Kaistella flava (ex Peng et al. 2021)]QOW11794.1 DUF1543 domain-containing protein [Kaistella flava (ex Peng et al. 2021)]
MKLFYIILGATPKGRNTEQHDVFFGIAETLKELIPEMKKFWMEAQGKIHIDCYQEVKYIDGFEVKIVEKDSQISEKQLFFINLGGYQHGKFEELHQQYLMVGKSMAEIIRRVKKTDFYKNMGFKNAESHIDDKHGVDIDDIFKVNDILSLKMKEKYSIVLEKTEVENQENYTFIGYLAISKLK